MQVQSFLSKEGNNQKIAHGINPITLLIFCTKCEGKFVPVSPTSNVANVATEHVQCTAAAGLGWWENRISSRLCQPIRDKL